LALISKQKFRKQVLSDFGPSGMKSFLPLVEKVVLLALNSKRDKYIEPKFFRRGNVSSLSAPRLSLQSAGLDVKFGCLLEHMLTTREGVPVVFAKRNN